VKVGVDLPYFRDPGEIRAYASAVEELGFDSLGYSEHVAASRRTAFPPNFAFDDPWHESTTLSAFLAAATTRIELNPSVLLVTLRHPVLAAKQTAEIDLLSGGRLRLAVAVGWNREEQVALGVDPTTRGERIEEQVELLRRLWDEKAVSYRGRHYQLDEIGIHPRPGRRIPIWLGAGSIFSRGVPETKVLERVARLADGFKMMAPLALDRERAASIVSELRALAGDRPVGVEGRMVMQQTDPDDWPDAVAFWKSLGADYLGVANRIAGGGVEEQLERLRAFVAATRADWA